MEQRQLFSPDFSQVCKYADQWIPLHAGSDGAFWMAVTHIILKEYHYEKQTPYFIDYTKRYTDSPMLVHLDKVGDSYTPGRMVRANELAKWKDIENGDWKFLSIDETSGEFVSPKGTMGYRWDKNGGKWNMKYECGETDAEFNPMLTLLNLKDEELPVEFTEFGLAKRLCAMFR